MKSVQTTIKSITLSLFSFFFFFLSGTYTSFAQKGNEGYTVAAYVWPSCHDEPMSREALWGEGIGEWKIIKKGNHVSKLIRILFHKLFIKTDVNSNFYETN